MFDVLVVDDEYIVCENIVKKIKRLNIGEINKIRVCYSGEEAIDICKKTYKPQIVITDMKMRTIDGIDLIRELKKWLFPVYFLVLSGYNEFDYVQGAFKVGADDYLLKPLLSEDLINAMEGAIKKLKSEGDIDNYSREHVLKKGSIVSDILNKNYWENSDISERKKFCAELKAEYCMTAVFRWQLEQDSDDMIKKINQILDYSEQQSMFDIYPAIIPKNRIVMLCNMQMSNCPELLDMINYFFEMWNSVHDPVSYGISEVDQKEKWIELTYHANNLVRQSIVLGYGNRYMKENHDVTDNCERCKKQILMYFNTPTELLLNNMIMTLKENFFSLNMYEVTYLYNIVKYCMENMEYQTKYIKKMRAIDQFADVENILRYLIKTLKEINGNILEHEKQKNVSIEKKAKEYIDRNFDTHITLKSVADYCSISYTHLSKMLSNYLGMSYREYLNLLRVNKAVKLLEDPNISIQEISEKVGCDNYLNFIRIFKNQQGTSPSQYRNNLKNNGVI